jgi:hypothetical protein
MGDVRLRQREQPGQELSAHTRQAPSTQVMVNLQRAAGNAAVTRMLARRPVQRLTSVSFNDDGNVARADYSRTPPMEYSLTLPKGAHVTAHVLFVEEAKKAIIGKTPAQAFDALLDLVKAIPSRTIYVKATKEQVALVDGGIQKLLAAYDGKKLTDLNPLFWGQTLARMFDAYISFRACLPGGIAATMSGQKQLLAHKRLIYNESKGMSLMADFAPAIYEVHLDGGRSAKKQRILEPFAAGMAITFDVEAAQEVGQGLEVLLAEHVNTCLALNPLARAEAEELQDYFLVYVGGSEYRGQVAKLTGIAALDKPTTLAGLDIAIGRKVEKHH